MEYFQSNYICQYLAAFTGLLAPISIGMHYGWTSPSLPILLSKTSDIPISNSEGGWITVAPVIGSPIGCILALLLVDRIGRRPSLLIVSPLSLAGWLLVAFTTTVYLLVLGRFLAGIANGLMFTVLPMYIGEIADRSIRGLLGSGVQTAFNIGLLAINIVGLCFSIKTTALLSAVLPVLFFVTFWWVPESPYFFISRYENEKAANSFQQFTKKDNDVEILQYMETIALQSNRSEKFMDLLLVDTNRKALCVLIGLMLLQHLSGFMAIMFYCFTIFKEANGAFKESFSTIIYFIVTLAASVASSLLVDRAGRKPLMILSVSVSGIALAIEGIYFYLKDTTNVDITGFSCIPLLSLILCTLSFNIGLTTIPILLMGELFPTNVKAFASCTSNIVFSLFGAIITKLFQIVKDDYGLYMPFCIFSSCCFLGLIFIFYCVPETKGKSLEQIQRSLKGSKSKEDITLVIEPRVKSLLNNEEQ